MVSMSWAKEIGKQICVAGNLNTKTSSLPPTLVVTVIPALASLSLSLSGLVIKACCVLTSVFKRAPN